ncbi:hypothetical protein BH10ACI1_BH10ACI1_25330 [soil metagenome]
MNIWRKATKVFALSFLFFVNFISINAQTIYELPAGTKIRVRMDNEINSKVSSVNDTFTTVISEPVTVRDAVVVPIGAIISGRIIKVKRASTGKKNGSLTLAFELLRFETGEKREIDGILVNQLTVKSSPIKDILSVLGGTAIGAILGGVSRSGSGAVIGAAVGTGAGAGAVFLQKGKDVSIKANEEFEIELPKNVTLPVRDY